MYRVAETQYRRTLDAHAVLDFSDLLLRALDLLRQMDEFSQSRYRLESRYHHVLVDEFQDTSGAQWRAGLLLVQSWREGAGLSSTCRCRHDFVVGDRKQSIYGFRDADVGVLRRRPAGFRAPRPASPSGARFERASAPCRRCWHSPTRSATHRERRPSAPTRSVRRGRSVSRWRAPRQMVSASPRSASRRRRSGRFRGAVAGEIARLLRTGTVRDRQTGVARAVASRRHRDPVSIARGHQEFEAALQQRGIPTYVYKGLGFFDTDEVKDVVAVLCVPGGSGVGSPCGGASAIAVRPAVGPGLAALAPSIAASPCTGAVDGDTRSMPTALP